MLNFYTIIIISVFIICTINKLIIIIKKNEIKDINLRILTFEQTLR